MTLKLLPRQNIFCQIFLILIVSCNVLAQQQTTVAITPLETTRTFYSILLSDSTSNQTQTLKAFLTTDLFNRYQQQKNRDDQHIKKTGELGCIDYDLLIGGQDIPKSFNVIGEKIINKDKVLVTVKLNYANPTKIVLHLVRINQGWKIADIQYPNLHTSMNAELKRCQDK